jgi:hypothetical protein
MQSAEAFTVIATGQIERCEVRICFNKRDFRRVQTLLKLLISLLQIPGVGNAYCKWGTVIGEDWMILNGLSEGITQVARRGRGRSSYL